MNDLLETYFDRVERAAMTRAVEPCDEKLAAEILEAREAIRGEFQRLQTELEKLKK